MTNVGIAIERQLDDMNDALEACLAGTGSEPAELLLQLRGGLARLRELTWLRENEDGVGVAWTRVTLAGIEERRWYEPAPPPSESPTPAAAAPAADYHQDPDLPF